MQLPRTLRGRSAKVLYALEKFPLRGPKRRWVTKASRWLAVGGSGACEMHCCLPDRRYVATLVYDGANDCTRCIDTVIWLYTSVQRDGRGVSSWASNRSQSSWLPLSRWGACAAARLSHSRSAGTNQRDMCTFALERIRSTAHIEPSKYSKSHIKGPQNFPRGALPPKPPRFRPATRPQRAS